MGGSGDPAGGRGGGWHWYHFLYHLRGWVFSECKDTAVAKRLFLSSMETSFEKERDRIMSVLYKSVCESCKGAVSLSLTRAEASSVVQVAEDSLGVSDGGQLDHERLGSLALSLHQILAKNSRRPILPPTPCARQNV